MIFGIGTDVVEVSRIHASIEKFGDTFARRILSDSEFESYLQSSTQSRFLAKRFAAKEAFAKALGTGIGRGVSFQHFSVSNNADGAPQLALSDYAAELAAKLGVNHIWLSITDEQAYAAATVILERQ